MISSKNNLIRYESELAHEFGNLIAADDRIEGIQARPKNHPGEISVALDGRDHRFHVQYLLTPTVQEIPSQTGSANAQPLLVVPRLSDLFLYACRENKVSVADLNGRWYLRDKGLLLELPAISGRDFRFDLEPRNVFVGKSVRIVRSLLADSERVWRQAELVERSGATSGLVSRIVTYLTRQGLLKKVDARRFRIVSPLALLDAWAKADDFSRRTVTHRFTTLSSEPVQLARKIRNVLTHGGPHFAFTQWIAAWLRHQYTEPSIVSLYVPSLPASELLDQLGLRPVNDAGRVWFHVPSDEGVFREKQFADDLPLVSDAQIYLDLLQTGLRGPEQAQALREWPGFCRP